MVTKWLKTGLIVVVCLCLVGGLLFGKDLVSYVRSSAKSVQKAVKNSVPIEFELRRARDLLEEIIPEMHANIRLIAQEEVEIAALKTDIDKSQKVSAQQQRLSCPKRSTIGAYLLDTLDKDWRCYVEFHLKKLECHYCLANLEDLKRKTAENKTSHLNARIMQSTIGFLHKP